MIDIIDFFFSRVLFGYFLILFAVSAVIIIIALVYHFYVMEYLVPKKPKILDKMDKWYTNPRKTLFTYYFTKEDVKDKDIGKYVRTIKILIKIVIGIWILELISVLVLFSIVTYLSDKII